MKIEISMRLALWTFVGALMSTTGLLAAPSTISFNPECLGKNAKQSFPQEVNPYHEVESDGVKAFDELMKKMKASSVRNVASAHTPQYDDSQFAQSFRELRDKYLAIKTPEALEQSLETLDVWLDKIERQPSEFVKVDPATYHLATLLVLLRPYRSFVYRSIPVFTAKDSKFLGFGNRAVHAGALTIVKAITAAISVYLPTFQWVAAADYLTSPVYFSPTPENSDWHRRRYGDSELHCWSRVEQIQDYLVAVVKPAYDRAMRRFSNLGQMVDPQKPVLFDNRLIYGLAMNMDGSASTCAHGNPALCYLDDGPSNFIEKHSPVRYSLFNGADYAYLRSSVALASAWVDIIAAYNLDDFIEVYAKLGSLQGLGGFSGDIDESVTAREKFKRIQAFKSFLTIRPEGQKRMASALRYLRLALADYKHSWNLLTDPHYYSNARSVLSREKLLPYKAKVDAQIAYTELLLFGPSQAGQSTFRSVVTGEVIQFDFVKFFTEAPGDLKALMPLAFEDSQDRKVRNVEVAGKKIAVGPFRNYLRGQSKAWSYAAWSKYMPGLLPLPEPVAARSWIRDGQVQATGDVERLLRTARQSWGGEALAKSFGFLFR